MIRKLAVKDLAQSNAPRVERKGARKVRNRSCELTQVEFWQRECKCAMQRIMFMQVRLNSVQNSRILKSENAF